MRATWSDLKYPLLAAVAALVLTLAYLPGQTGFFANDDWVLLYHYGQIPAWRFWEYFSPHTVWFYRPLQSLLYGVLYQAFGLNPVPYNVLLLVMHLGVCALAYCWVRELGGRPPLAALAVTFFAAQWVYGDVVLWKANFNTLQWALASLGAATAFARHLRTGSRRALLATYALCAVNLFTKEMALNLPFLLVLEWAYFRLPAQRPQRERLLGHGREVARLLAPVLALLLVYGVAHRLLVKDAYGMMKVGYFLVDPLTAVRQSLFIYNHSLLSFYPDVLLLPHVPGLRAAVQAGVQYGLVLPLVLLLLGVRLRDRMLLLGVGWIFLAFLPCVFLRDFSVGRYYYLPAVGAALIWGRLLGHGWGAAATVLARAGENWTPARLARPALVGIALYALIANVGITQRLVSADRESSQRVEALYRLLRDRRGEMPRGVLIVVRNAPSSFLGNGLGIRELAKLALNDPAAEGVADGQNMEPARLAVIRAIPNVVVVDLARRPLTLEPVRGTPRSAANPL